jgi:hypothetical protein
MEQDSKLADVTKRAGAVLTTISGAAYACGYIVLRARAHALGTDPGFALVDQAYVFAGFRFVLMTLFALLLTSPLLLAAYHLARLARRLRHRLVDLLEAVGTTLAGLGTVLLFFVTFSVSDVLLRPPELAPTRLARLLAEAALDRNAVGTLMVLGTTLSTALLLIWTHTHHRRAGRPDAQAGALLLIATLLMVLLPVQHGVFLADRNVRALERAPEGTAGLEQPIWLVDRGAGDRAVLMARQADGRAKLVTVKVEQLDGIAVTEVASLGAALGKGAGR